MPAKGTTGRWSRPENELPPVRFERSELVLTPTGQLARVTQNYHKGSNKNRCAIRYENGGGTAVIHESLLRPAGIDTEAKRKSRAGTVRELLSIALPSLIQHHRITSQQLKRDARMHPICQPWLWPELEWTLTN